MYKKNERSKSREQWSDDRGEFGDPRSGRIATPEHRSTPLDPGLRADMEARFGHQFGSVRIWPEGGPGPNPDSLGGADAYALGDDVVFAGGAYRPETLEGKLLLAHELAHVVQQSHGETSDAAPSIGERDSRAEGDANRAGLEAVSGRVASVHVATPPTIARGFIDDIIGIQMKQPVGGAAYDADEGSGTAAGFGDVVSRIVGGVGGLFNRGASSLGRILGGASGLSSAEQGVEKSIGGDHDAGMERQIELQHEMARQTQQQTMMSNMLKRYDDTGRGIVQNLR